MSNMAEKSVIGCLLMDINSIKYIYGKLKADMFFDPVYKDAYSEILKGYDLGNPKNVAQLSQYMQSESFTSDQIGRYLIECIGAIASSVEIKKYAEVVVNDYKAYTLNKMLQSIKVTSRDIDFEIGALINELDALKGQDRTTAKKLSDIVSENREKRFIERMETQLFTGLPNLDDCLGGLEGGDVIVIGARPAVGKSALTAQITTSMASTGKRVCFYNLEMSESQIYDRYLSRESGIGLTRIRRAEAFLGDEKKKFDTANERLSGMDIIISSGSKSISEIRNEVRHLEADCIVIDYLQLVKADVHYVNRTSEVGAISKAIKGLSTELNVPIILLSQLNRLSEQKADKEPLMSELREAGDIEQDASIIILMWNPDRYDEAKKALKVEKNRQGTTLREILRFDGNLMSFKETKEQVTSNSGGFKRTESSPFDEE